MDMVLIQSVADLEGYKDFADYTWNQMAPWNFFLASNT